MAILGGMGGLFWGIFFPLSGGCFRPILSVVGARSGGIIFVVIGGVDLAHFVGPLGDVLAHFCHSSGGILWLSEGVLLFFPAVGGCFGVCLLVVGAHTGRGACFAPIMG